MYILEAYAIPPTPSEIISDGTEALVSSRERIHGDVLECNKLKGAPEGGVFQVRALGHWEISRVYLFFTALGIYFAGTVIISARRWPSRNMLGFSCLMCAICFSVHYTLVMIA